MKYVDKDLYRDNIFNIVVPMNDVRNCKQICGINIVTREWVKFFDIVSPYPNLDRWLSELSKQIGRRICVGEDSMMSYFPKGHRTLSKLQRKELFYPLLKKYVKKFKERI